MSDKKCVVCSSPAEIFCHNDNAYLCALCDVTVHQAHPLAASHHREPLGKPHKEDSLESLFDVPTVPDALCDHKELFGSKPDAGKLGSLDLSLDDDAFFAVPDTTAKAGRTSLDANGPLSKGFISEDLFGFDAGFDDFGFALEHGGSDMLVDCLVPDADALHGTGTGHIDIESDLPFDIDPVAVTCAAASKGSAADSVPFPGDSPHMSTPTSSGLEIASGEGLIPSFDNFLPISLIPMDAERCSALQERRMKVYKFWEKKKTRQFKKTIRYASRKRYAEVRPRIKGRFARKDEILAAQAAGVPLM